MLVFYPNKKTDFLKKDWQILINCYIFARDEWLLKNCVYLES